MGEIEPAPMTVAREQGEGEGEGEGEGGGQRVDRTVMPTENHIDTAFAATSVYVKRSGDITRHASR